MTEPSPWTPALVTAVFAGIGVVILALTTAVLRLQGVQSGINAAAREALAARTETVISRAAGIEAGVARDAKLDQISSNVNGHTSALKHEISCLRQDNKALRDMLRRHGLRKTDSPNSHRARRPKNA